MQVNGNAWYLSHVNGSKNIGDAYARKMEAIFRKPVGWLDHDHQLMDMNKEKAIVIDNLVRDALAVTSQNVAKSLLKVLRSSHKLAHSARAMRYERQLK